jgi:N-acetylglutamate synthase-like GNAT family acetyltransferase
VSALLGTAYPVLMGPAYDEALLAPALELMSRANPDLLASGQYYVAETPAGLVIGCGGWTLQRPGDGAVEPGLGHIRHFGTHPGWTNRGIGRAIYGLCETAARSMGVARLECYSSLNAEGFYAALGFESVRRVELALGPNVGLPAVLMRRGIQAPLA